MKKICMIVLGMCTSMILFAQNRLTTPMTKAVRFGIKAGVNLAEFRLDDFPSGAEPSVSRKAMYNGGFLVNIPLGSGGFAVEPELLYSAQGSKVTQNTTVGTYSNSLSYEQHLNYIILPVMVQWKSQGGFFVETGPQPGYLVHARQVGPGTADVENKSSFEKLDFTWNAGLGYLSRIGLGIGARYNYGITNTLKEQNSNDGSDSNPKLKNSVIQIGLSWHFGAGK